MSEVPSLSTLPLPQGVTAADVLSTGDQIGARIHAVLLPPEGSGGSGEIVLPPGVELLVALPPHIGLPWARYKLAAAALRKLQDERAIAQGNQAYAAADDTEQEAANAEVDDSWRAVAQWVAGAAGLRDDGLSPSPSEARWLQLQLFAPAEGLQFITRRPRVQWDAMEQRMRTLELPRAQAVIAGFGGQRHLAQLVAAHARFGKAFGFTAAVIEPVGGPTDGRPQWSAARDAFRTLVQKIESYADPEIAGSEALAAFLLQPYVDLVADIERARRSAPAKQPAPAPSGAPVPA